jgi:FdhD protein
MAAMLGISMIASRTSPTDMAVKMCEEEGIVLIGRRLGGGEATPSEEPG